MGDPGVGAGAKPIQQILDYTNGFAEKQKWDYSSWTPDAVVILIGPNDESNSFNATGGAFVKAYLSLLNQVAKNYAQASPPPKIVHVCGGSLNGFDPCDDIQTANKQFNANSAGIKGHYTSITKATWERINNCKNGMDKCNGKSAYNGCDGHYNIKGHAAVVADIQAQFKQVMGW